MMRLFVLLMLGVAFAACQDPPDDPTIGEGERCDHPRSSCRVDADCGDGRCGAVPDDPGTPCHCIDSDPTPERGSCDPALQGECCEDTDCPGAQRCQRMILGPQNEYCGGARPPEDNVCRGDMCQADVDCDAGQVCIPAGAFGFVFNTCRGAGCRSDADCDARPGGECRPYFTPCLSGAFGCSYADDPCRTDADCPPGLGDVGCVPQPGGGTACVDELPRP